MPKKPSDKFAYKPVYDIVEGRTVREATEQFFAVVCAQLDAHYKVARGTHKPQVTYGSKYNRVGFNGSPYTGPGHYCSIDTEGNIYKAGGYGRPAKHPRANVLRYDYLDACGPYGMKYLTGGGNYKFYKNGVDKSPMEMARDALVEGRTEDACNIMYELASEGRT